MDRSGLLHRVLDYLLKGEMHWKQICGVLTRLISGIDGLSYKGKRTGLAL